MPMSSFVRRSSATLPRMVDPNGVFIARGSTMTKSTYRVVTRAADGNLRTRDYDSAETLTESHTQIGVDDCSTDLDLRGLPVFRGLVGPMPEGVDVEAIFVVCFALIMIGIVFVWRRASTGAASRAHAATSAAPLRPS